MPKQKAKDSDQEHSFNFAQLHRSSTNYIIAGVAGGIGEYFKVDPLIIRILFIILTIFGGSGILLYILLWILMPGPQFSGSNFSGDSFRRFANDLSGANLSKDSHLLLGWIVLGLGVILLLDNLGLFQYFDIGRLWPIILVIFGILLLSRHG